MYAIVFHAHQKLDRVARRHINRIAGNDVFFPSSRRILHFEGKNGPDAVKLKQQNVEQPWHFVDPFNIADTELHDQIVNHHAELAIALKAHDIVRASFEAAWLAHALVDGLTPAHHYPYEQELENLRGGEGRNSRKGLVGRVYVKGDNRLTSLQQSYKLVGPKGLLTTHAMFEAGAYSIIAPLRLTRALPTAAEQRLVRDIGVVAYFQRLAKEVAALDMYTRFYEKGWTTKLSRDIRKELAPRMVSMITLAWYSALCEAEVIPEP